MSQIFTCFAWPVQSLHRELLISATIVLKILSIFYSKNFFFLIDFFEGSNFKQKKKIQTKPNPKDVVEEWEAGCAGRAGWDGAGAACPHKWFGSIFSQRAGPVVGFESSEAQKWRLKTLLSFFGLSHTAYLKRRPNDLHIFISWIWKKEIFFFSLAFVWKWHHSLCQPC